VIELGDVFFLNCTLCVPPKDKFFVVVQVQPLRMLLINSELNTFLLGKPKRLALHIPLMQIDHSAFLTHDSYLACDHLSHEYNYERLLRLSERNPSLRKGSIHADAKPKIAKAFAENHLIPRKYLHELVQLWEQRED